ncbi:MAG: ribonuclease P protein component 2 [Thermococci archaeon]|nr:ribonuclease P protein component 2 [Thermococci archaeon]
MRTRPKTLPPTLRDKRRYIAFQVVGERKLKTEEVRKALWSSFLTTLGTVGTARADPWLVEFDEDGQTGIIRADRRHVEEVRFALVLVRKVNGSRVIIRTLGVSGTIKRLRRKFLGDDP